MRTIERTGQFKRDYKRRAKGRHRTTLDADLVPVLVALANDRLLEPRHRDHALTGDWKDYRDCHVKPFHVEARRLHNTLLDTTGTGAHNGLQRNATRTRLVSGRAGRPNLDS